jgi:hypothetical protein
MPMGEAIAAIAATAEHVRGSKPAAMKCRAAAAEAAGMNCRAMEASAAMEASTMATSASAVATPATATAMTTHFDGLSAGNMLRRVRRTRIDQRQRFRALADRSRHDQYRASRKRQATDNAAPGIWNLHHGQKLPRCEATKAWAMPWPAFGAFNYDRSQH